MDDDKRPLNKAEKTLAANPGLLAQLTALVNDAQVLEEAIRTQEELRKQKEFDSRYRKKSKRKRDDDDDGPWEEAPADAVEPDPLFVHCFLCGHVHELSESIFVQPPGLNEPQWVCRELAEQRGYEEYIVK